MLHAFVESLSESAASAAVNGKVVFGTERAGEDEIDMNAGRPPAQNTPGSTEFFPHPHRTEQITYRR